MEQDSTERGKLAANIGRESIWTSTPSFQGWACSMLQEASLEFRNQPRTLAQAKTEADDFLRRLRAGVI